MAELGRLREPFPVTCCANVDCQHDPDLAALSEHGAYLYRDLGSNKLVVFCGDCSRHAELNAAERFMLVALVTDTCPICGASATDELGSSPDAVPGSGVSRG